MSHPPIIPPLAAHGRLACTEAELIAWGESLGRAVTPPLVITIAGELGAGKTTLARAICGGYGVADEVTSPTFTLVHQYQAPKSSVYHVDLYRLSDPRDLTNLGWDEMLAEDALVLIEWPERAGNRIPHVHLPISLQHLPDEPGRRLLYAGGHV
ncbi:MAG TPA: tRNA (adenosine(37)-N6)-threonylcarbamoyltransferase complex ATPase subunit type 1 TsaE [Gemmatimonadaceae bacterium]|jgi:tRNA threonylcarbamoyladenosine biosynthesis protein TsaE|nr:tRNA (adenosine(37)-N6)-threonylcarbamoyltransferase complex ATPase subunit type 1 TsaE [Gemmatimonadaceae bacterium]